MRRWMVSSESRRFSSSSYDQEIGMKYFKYTKTLESSETEIVYTHSGIMFINSSPPSAACMRQCISSALVQIMACCLEGTKPLSEPMLTYLFEMQIFSFNKVRLNTSTAKWRPLCPGGDELTHSGISKPYDKIDLDGHFIKYWFVVWQHHAITQTIHLRAISQWALINLICNMCSKITLLK